LNVPASFWKALRQEAKTLNPDFVLLAEAWTGMADIAPYYNQEFDATFDFPIYGEIEGNQDQVGDSLLLGVKSARTLDGLLIAQQVLFPNGAQRVEFINNHDTNRAMSEVNGDVKRAKLGALLELTLPGTPMIYYGEEIGMRGVKAPAPDYDKSRREPMDWYAAETGPGMTTWYRPDSRNNRSNDGFSVQEEMGKPDSLLEYYRTLAALRNSNSALRSGYREGISQDSQSAYAYLRRDEKGGFLIVMNFGTAPATLHLDLGPSTLPTGQYRAVDVFAKKEWPVTNLAISMGLDAASGTILQLVPR
jgi:glycosidase